MYFLFIYVSLLFSIINLDACTNNIIKIAYKQLCCECNELMHNHSKGQVVVVVLVVVVAVMTNDSVYYYDILVTTVPVSKTN